MQKSPSAFRTISEVSEILEIPAHVLRFWESKFTQIKPVKRGGGRRYYRPEDVWLIRTIQHLLHEQGLTIKGAQKVVRERGVKAIIAMGKDLLENEIVPEVAVAETLVPRAVTATPTLQNSQLEAVYKRLLVMRNSIQVQIAELA